MANFQIKLSEQEQRRLILRVGEDFTNAITDHNARMDRWAGYLQKWKARVDPPKAGDEAKSNYQVPMVQWYVFGKWAREMNALLGDDAEIVAKPVGPSDYKITHKVGRYMTWRMFNSMRITNPLAVFLFRKILYGRAFAYAPWVRNRYEIPGGMATAYEGPGFFPVDADDIILPAEDFESVQDASFVVRRYRATPDELLRGDGTLYQGIDKNFATILQHSRTSAKRDTLGEQVKREKDRSEGISYESSSAGESIIVHEWYGRWRPLRKGQDAEPYDIKKRRRETADWVVRIIPDLDLLIGVQDLMELYPKMQRRRPIVEASLVKDGTYWSPGICELSEQGQEELTANHNLFQDAGEASVSPAVFAKPMSGAVQPGKHITLDSGKIYFVEDPQGIKVLDIRPNLQFNILKEQGILSYYERVLGLSDMALGRSLDRPNSPKTATGQVALLEQGNLRLYLDNVFLREDMAQIVNHFWALDREFAPPQQFFRVTEEESKGLFGTSQGGAQMTAQERANDYDFQVRFANSPWSRAAQKQEAIELYAADLQNPLIAMNPKALWRVTNNFHRAMGDPNFGDAIQEPPDMGEPMNPREEWAIMQRGEERDPNPMDNDDLHLQIHLRHLEEAQSNPERDVFATKLLIEHIRDHQNQKRRKVLLQALTQKLVRNLASPEEPVIPGSPGPPLPPQEQDMGEQPLAPGLGIADQEPFRA